MSPTRRAPGDALPLRQQFRLVLVRLWTELQPDRIADRMDRIALQVHRPILHDPNRCRACYRHR